MAIATDYLTVAEARLDLRLDDDTFTDSAIERFIRQGVSLVGSTTGRDLLAVAAADVDDGLRSCVSAATWMRFEGVTYFPSSFYALCSPYRAIVSTADSQDDEDDTDAAGTEDFGMVQSETFAVSDGQTLVLDVRDSRLPFAWAVRAPYSGSFYQTAGDPLARFVFARAYVWPAGAGDWLTIPLNQGEVRSIDDGVIVERTESAPISGLRWIADGADITVRINFSANGSISGTVS